MPPTPLNQFALQGAAVVLVLSLAWPYFGWKAEPLPWQETCFAIGGAAFVLATLARLPWPWRIVHALVVPLVWALYPAAG
jgi:nicotinamide riboside transporter PnuC